MVAVFENNLAEFLLFFRCNVFRCDQVGKPVDRVQRCADFVTHVLNEGILHLFTFLCFLAGKDDQAVRLLQFLI